MNSQNLYPFLNNNKQNISLKLYDPYEGYIRGNMFSDIYSNYKINTPFYINPLNDQANLLTYIDMYSFAAHDLNLYLDIFPDNKEVIDLYNQYKQESNRLTKEYENKYGPLSLNSEFLNKYPWQWINTPWPWDFERS
ncbi:MAG: spore coat protein CotJB [Bacilli bacterium]|nr:spore coat protein CotJB [Bacilli bacterium]